MDQTRPPVQETILVRLRNEGTSLSNTELEQLAALIVEAIDEQARLGNIPKEMLEEALEPAIASPPVQLVLAQSGSSIEDVSQSIVQNIFAFIIEDIRFMVPEFYSSEEYCPYPGLASFSEAEAYRFCGRDEDLETFLANINRPLLALTGPSGVGKSSFISAGVLPKLRAEYGDRGIYLTYRMNAGEDLLGDFATFLSQIANQEATLIQQSLEEQDGALVQTFGIICNEEYKPVFLVIDQFEALFVGEEQERKSQRQRLLDNLLQLEKHDWQGQMLVILVSRENYFEHPDYIERPRLRELIQRENIVLYPLTDKGLREAIERPLERFNQEQGLDLKFQDGLVSLITQAFRNPAISLPLVQYLLRLLWTRERFLSHVAYNRLGGLDRVLDRHASEIYQNFGEADQPLVCFVLLRLVQPGISNEYTRKRVRRSSLLAFQSPNQRRQIESILHRLSDERSRIISEQKIGDTAYLELTHEVILKQWSFLQTLIEVQKQQLEKREWLLPKAELWQRSVEQHPSRGDTDYLYQRNEWRSVRCYLELQSTGVKDILIEECYRESQRYHRRILIRNIAITLFLVILVVWFQDQANRRLTEGQATAEAATTVEAIARATAEAQARSEVIARQKQETIAAAESIAKVEQERIAKSITLAQQSEFELESGYKDRAVLLALIALEQYAYTTQAERALGRAIQNYRSQIIINSNMELTDVELSPDGKKIALAGNNSLVRILSSDTGTELNRFDSRGGPIANVEWAPDGSRVAGSGFDNGTIFLWDVSSGEIVGELLGDQRWVSNISWASDSRRLGVATQIPPNASDGPLIPSRSAFRIWDTVTQTPITTISDDENGLLGGNSSLMWIPDTDTLISTDFDHFIRMLDAGTGRVLQKREIVGFPADIAVSPNQQSLLVSVNDGSVLVYSAVSLDYLYTLSNTGIQLIDWSTTGLLASSDDRTLVLRDNQTGQVRESLYTHPDRVISISWSTDGGFLASASEDGTIVVTRIADQRDNISFFHGYGNYPIPAVVNDLDWSPNGDLLVSACEAGYLGSVVIWDVTTHKQVEGFPVLTSIANSVSWSPEGDLVAIGDKRLHIWDITSREELIMLEQETAGVNSLAWSPDGSRIAIILGDGLGRIWGGNSYYEELILNHPNNLPLTNVAWSPDGRQIALAANDGSVFIWNLNLNAVELSFKGHFGKVADVAWSADGEWIATAGNDGTAQIWEAQSGTAQGIFSGHDGPVTSVDWSNDGKRVLSTSEDHTSRIWDVENTSELFIFRDTEPVNNAKWSPDDSLIAIASSSGHITLYRSWPTTDALIEYAKKCCVWRELTQEEIDQFDLSGR